MNGAGGTTCDASLRAVLNARHAVLMTIRRFFDHRGYLEVESPALVRTPGFDVHVDAIPAGRGLYLSTSPELHMKRLLCAGSGNIYQITRAFRDDERGHWHAPEFTMLEWYRIGADCAGLMDETRELLAAVAGEPSAGACLQVPEIIPVSTVTELYLRHAGWDPCCQWDEQRYFRDWVERIDPALQQVPVVFVNGFPAALAALSRVSFRDPRVCERFELFLRGIEVANAYHELQDYGEHCSRWERVRRDRRQCGKPVYPTDRAFLGAIQKGLPACAGIALGVDRLIMALRGCSSIDQVQPLWQEVAAQ